MEKKGYLEISFGWLFAIIAGITIIFLAIYFSTKLINIERTSSGVETTKEIGILTNPLETGFESAKTSSFTLPLETRIMNKCDSYSGVFGEQKISLSEKSLNQWKETGVDVSFENKYFFSEDEVEGKTFHVFSKQFEFPFKIADLIYLTSSLDTYCFVNSPQEVQEEISNLNQENLKVAECPEESITVCFDFGNCDINVKADYVKKQNKNSYYEGNIALMYAAIFSSPEVYECQLNRLMKRASEIASLYNDKGEKLLDRGCDFNLGTELLSFSSSAASSSSLSEIKSQADKLNDLNKMSECLLW
ncbi:MAG: hypothetical protein Q7S06_01240 [Nanoarchaeota archaeon]|nr:hypothetical protein [Nanoarchaeota archaeon]